MKDLLSRPSVCMTGFLVTAVCLAYFQVVFLDRTLLATAYYPTPLAPTATEQRGGNTFDVDLATPAFFEAPVNCLIGKLWRTGEVPLWNPYQMAGTPLAAQYSTRAFFPYQILQNLFSPLWWDYFLLGRLVIAGLFTSLFLRSLGLSTACALLGGIAYSLSGSFTWFINLEQFTNTALMIPVCIFFCERAARFPTLSRLSQVSLAMGLMLLAGQPEIALWVILLCGLFFILSASERQRWLRAGPILRFSIAVVMALALSALLLLPFLELTLHSFHTHSPGGTSGIESPAFMDQAVSLLIPSFSELPTYHRTFPHNGVWDGLGGYTGVLIPLLILVALPLKGRHRIQLLFFSIFAVAILLKNFGIPPISWIGYLPLFDQSWSPRWAGPVWTFSLACAAAIAAQAIVETSTDIQRSVERSVVVIAVALAVFVPQARYVNVMMLPRMAPDVLRTVLPPIATGLLVTIVVLIMAAWVMVRWRGARNFTSSLIFLLFLELWFFIPRGADSQWTILRLIPFFLGLVVVVLMVRGWGKVGWAMALLILTLFPLFSFRTVGLPRRIDLSAEPQVVKRLKREAGFSRIISGDGVLMPNLASCYELYDIRYVNSLAPLTFQNYVDSHLLAEPHTWWVDRLWFNGLPDLNKTKRRSLVQEMKDNHRYYSFLGVRYILAHHSTPLDLPLLGEEEETLIYLNEAALPRVFVVHDYVVEDDFQAAQSRMGDPNLDLGKTVVLEAPSFPISSPRLAAAASWATIERYDPRQVTIRAGLESEGILVLTDLHYPGWTVYVNDRQEPLLRVNGLVRGVVLKPGSHRVTFRYAPASFRIGLIVSLVALFLCAVGLILGRRNLGESR